MSARRSKHGERVRVFTAALRTGGRRKAHKVENPRRDAVDPPRAGLIEWARIDEDHPSSGQSQAPSRSGTGDTSTDDDDIVGARSYVQVSLNPVLLMYWASMLRSP